MFVGRLTNYTISPKKALGFLKDVLKLVHKVALERERISRNTEGGDRQDRLSKMNPGDSKKDSQRDSNVDDKKILYSPQPNECSECMSSHLSFDSIRGELFCESCGFVIEDKLIDEKPEWSAYNSEDQARLSRVGPPIKHGTLNSQLTTVVGSGSVDSRGTRMSPKALRTYYHLGRLQRQVVNSSKGTRSVGAVSRALNRLASQLQLPPAVIEEASYLSMKSIKLDILRGRSIQSLVSATIYMSCRNLGVPRTLNEVVEASGISRKRLTKTVNIISRTLGVRAKPVDATDYVARFCSELSLSDDVRALAGSILSKTPEENSLSPPGTAASAIYLAALAKGQRVPQKRVAQVAGVSEVTLRSHFKLFENVISVDVPRGRASPNTKKPKTLFQAQAS